MPTVTLITSRQVLIDPAQGDPELLLVQAELVGRGARCELADWRQASVLSASDLVVIKSPWDYPRHTAEFLTWLDRTESQTRVLNHPEVIRWNLDKRYLAELAGRGVEVCPTVFCRTPDEVRGAIATLPGRVVVKPTVSASSANTGLFEPDDPAALDLARRIVELGKEVMVQPAIASIAELGERSLVYIDGRLVHAVRRGPLLALGGGMLPAGDRVASVCPVDAAPDERALAEQVLAVAAESMTARSVRESFLYARVDLVRDAAGRPMLAELELFEPSLFLRLAPGAKQHYADAVLARLEV
ncbi:MAG: hypothetical protein QM619_06515 [Micropruina sp.]|uniref:ATP-grasp domain-containing protein n=1 Tax=Micropruina sp. TaxID=2737536 RepID=UPI0039E2FF4D